MELPRQQIERLVPSDYPPEQLVSPTQWELSFGLESELLRRSFLWANAIVTAGFQSMTPLEPGFSHFSAGFVTASSEQLLGLDFPNANGFAFGANVLIRGRELKSNLLTLTVGDHRLPLVVNYGNLEHHGGPPHPVNGSGTCWVRNNAKGEHSWTSGILTCRHVINGLPLWTPIDLEPSGDHNLPTSATLADFDEFTIDASILEVGESDWPDHISRMPIQRPAAPGQRVEFKDRNGSLQTGSVLRVFYFPTYAGNLFGQRVIADCYGTGGDSGSLLMMSGSGLGVGIYMGTIPDGQGGKEGMFQDLAQVRDYFELELYL